MKIYLFSFEAKRIVVLVEGTEEKNIKEKAIDRVVYFRLFI